MPLLLIQVIVYCLVIWLGAYLLKRNYSKIQLRLMGLGLLAYGAALAIGSWLPFVPENLLTAATQVQQFIIYFPAIIWIGGLISLLPDDHLYKGRYYKAWQIAVSPGLIIVLFLNIQGYVQDVIVAVMVSLPLFWSLALFIISAQKSKVKPPLGLTIIGSIFFALSVGLFLPLKWIAPPIMALAIGLDILILGLGIAILDGFEEGHTIRRDMLLSLESTIILALVFGGQVGLVIYLGTGITFPMIVLLFTSLTTAIAIQTLISPLQSFIVSILNPNQTNIRLEQTQLHSTASSIPLLNQKFDFNSLDVENFAMLTRRAISYLGDLPRLASNPLTLMPQIEKRLATKDIAPSTLSRANELKVLLGESIHKLKPVGGELFGDTDEWRYFNSLYYPYVVGIKPSKHLQSAESLQKHEIKALEWLQREVPERTLHNWQNAASKLIAKELRDQF